MPSCPANPDFRRKQVQQKADPEGDAKKDIRRQAGKAATREEQADDRSNGRDRCEIVTAVIRRVNGADSWSKR